MDARLDAAIVAFCTSQEVEMKQVKGAALRLNPLTDDEELSIVVDYGIRGTKEHYVSVAELEALVFESAEPEPEPEEPDVVQTSVPIVVALDSAPGISAAMVGRMQDAGVMTLDQLIAAIQAGTLIRVPGIGGATMAKIENHLKSQGYI